MFREADAVWTDSPYVGKGSVSLPSRVLSNTTYVIGAADIGNQTTPGELLAAAIASSVSATIALKMTRLGARPASVSTHATILLEQLVDTWRSATVHLDVTAQISETDVRFLEEALRRLRLIVPLQAI